MAAFAVEKPLAVKWPNDLFLDGKKTAGILIQNALSGARLQNAVVGIGLNVNQVQFPPDLPNATSMALALGRSFDTAEVEAQLFSCLEQRYLQLKSGQKAAAKAEYEHRLWRLGERTAFVRQSDGSRFEGRITGVTEQGLLRVQMGDKEEVFGLKEVALIS
jgi:BirA family biotin operon repressor/biotin-[acetyl-CoA-carboxylase] ligase